MITKKTLKLSLKSLRDFGKKRLPDEVLIELDERDECPEDIVHTMCNPDQLGIQLLFVPEEYGGMGGSTFDVYLICEEMARIDLGAGHFLICHIPRQRSHYGRRDAGAEEAVAEPHRRMKACCLPTVLLSRKPAATSAR